MEDKTGRTLTSTEVLHKSTIRIETVWREFIVANLHCVGHIPIHCIRRFFYRLAGLKIGKGSAIHMGARFYNPKNITIGEDSIIGEGVVLDGRDRLVIGNHVDIASDVMIYNCQHDASSQDFRAVSAPVTIEDYVFIGPRAIILPGIRIGKGAVIAAGAVATKNIAPMSIVGGIPAVEIDKRNIKELRYTLGRAAWFR